jgi:hypothetical protein
VLHCKGHNSSIRSATEVNEHLMERLFDKISNRSSPTSISRQQGLQIIKTFCHYFCWVLQLRLKLVIHTWDQAQVGAQPRRWRTLKRYPRTSSSLATTIGGKQGRPSQIGGPTQDKFESISGSQVKQTPGSHTDSVFDDS